MKNFIWEINLSEQQERKMVFDEMIVVQVPNRELHCFLQNHKLKRSFDYLYRVKRISNNHSLVLIDNDDEMLELVSEYKTLKHLVPAFKPVTLKQYCAANSIWKTLKLNFDQKIPASLPPYLDISKFLPPQLCNIEKVKCSGYCVIFDNITEVPIKTEFDMDIPIFGHSILKCVSEVCSINNENRYLCNNLFAILLFEPCTSCAMALVHSRIKKVGIVDQANSYYKTFSKLKFNHNKNLNHKIDVFFAK